ncbi:MAG: PAS domain S-box protein [Pseudomonadota bacterium]|nr:PAS domain S-box protein [Pseudomonadota bacterium]
MPIPHLRAVIDAAVDAVFVIDQSGHICMANAAAEGLFGWSAAQMKGRDVSMLMPEPDRSAHASYIARFLATGEPRIIGTGRDVQAQRRDGSCFPVHLSVGQVAGSDPPRFIGFLHDLSARQREAEDALRLNQRLMQVTRMATLGEMSAGIAHEVNQPLTAITNYALAAERLLGFAEPDIEEARGALREIVLEARRAADIIRRLRHISRGGEASNEPTRVPELLEELEILCVADARAHDTRIRFELHPDVPPLLVHRVQITQAVLNLVRNALEALEADPPGGREVVVTARRNFAGDCEIEVSDNGPGVAAAIIDRMFEPFRTTKASGTGLGLPMCQTIAFAHGGSVRHETQAPRGARFILTLPAAEA